MEQLFHYVETDSLKDVRPMLTRLFQAATLSINTFHPIPFKPFNVNDK